MRPAALRDARLAAQLLGRRARRAPEDVVGHLLAVQAQDLPAARLALRARSQRLTATAVDAALADGRLCADWLMRGTLHLVRSDDHAWLHALTARTRLAASRRRLGQEGVTPDAAERAVALVERTLADEGPRTRAELGTVLAGHGIRTEGQALPHLLALAALRGVCVLGPVGDDGRQTFVLARDHVGPQPAVDRDAALAELARRYLTAHGPATEADLAAWSGLPLRDARAGLAAVATQVVEARGCQLALADTDTGRGARAPRLLAAFDPVLLGYARRDWLVEPAHARRVHPGTACCGRWRSRAAASSPPGAHAAAAIGSRSRSTRSRS